MDTTATATPAASVNTPAGAINVNVVLPAEAVQEKKSLLTWKNAGKVLAVCAIGGAAYAYRDSIAGLFSGD